MNVIEVNDTTMRYATDIMAHDADINTVLMLNTLFSEESIRRMDGNYLSNKNNPNKHMALWFGPVDYQYGKYKSMKSCEMPDFIKHIATIIEDLVGYERDYLNSVYINRYNYSGIGKHHDNDVIFKSDKSWNGGKDIEVAVYSLGGESVISVYDRYDSDTPLVNHIAIHNSVYTMDKNFQNKFYHSVGNSNGVRYSLTYRNCKLKD